MNILYCSVELTPTEILACENSCMWLYVNINPDLMIYESQGLI